MNTHVIELELYTQKTVSLTVTRNGNTVVLSSDDQSWKCIIALAPEQQEIKTNNLTASWSENFPGLDEAETKLLRDEILKKPNEFWENK